MLEDMDNPFGSEIASRMTRKGITIEDLASGYSDLARGIQDMIDGYIVPSDTHIFSLLSRKLGMSEVHWSSAAWLTKSRHREGHLAILSAVLKGKQMWCYTTDTYTLRAPAQVVDEFYPLLDPQGKRLYWEVTPQAGDSDPDRSAYVLCINEDQAYVQMAEDVVRKLRRNTIANRAVYIADALHIGLVLPEDLHAGLEAERIAEAKNARQRAEANLRAAQAALAALDNT